MRVLLLIDRRLGDLLRIGTQARLKLFEFDIHLVVDDQQTIRSFARLGLEQLGIGENWMLVMARRRSR